MKKYLLTNKAVRDLSDIWNYTFNNWSEFQADKYYRLLKNSFEKIAEKPNAGKPYNEVSDNLLGYKAGHHIVFYRVENDNKVLIIRILHERMDLKRRLKK